jgi:hypothetical protein
MRDNLGGQGLAVPFRTELRGVVHAQVRNGNQPGEAGELDDVSAALGTQMRQKQPE